MRRVRTRWRIGLLVCWIVFGWSGAVRAANVVLMNGEEIHGELLEVSTDEVVLRIGGGLVRVALRDVQDVRLNSGESVWEQELRVAIRKSRDALRHEATARLAAELERRAREGSAAATKAAEHGDEGQVVAPAATGTRLRFSGRFRSPHSGLALRYPLQWQVEQPEPGYITFRDPRPDAVGIWRFNVTVFDRVETDLAEVTKTAHEELARLSNYRTVRTERVRVGVHPGEHTVGMYEDVSGTVRHDQVVIETQRNVIVLEFFTPGYPSADGEVPEVAAVLASLELR